MANNSMKTIIIKFKTKRDFYYDSKWNKLQKLMVVSYHYQYLK